MNIEIFQDYSDKELNIEFTKGKRNFKKSSETMTNYQNNFQTTQTQIETNTQQVQFDHQELQLNKANLYATKFDKDKLSKFLMQIYPQLMIELEETSNLKKYNCTNFLIVAYQPQLKSQKKETELVYILSNQQNKALEIEKKFEITDIQWNSNGLILAASYGCLEHLGQCSHNSYICCWNIFKRGFKPDKPTTVIETNACNMCIQFHPSSPNILAIGTFNGELYLFDISQNQELAHSTIDDYFHRESITSILWLQDESIMTLGCEGKILIWNPKKQNGELSLKFPLKGCYLVRKKESQTETVGGLCIAQSNDDPYTFIIGSEGGSVLKAQISPINYTMTKQSYLDSRDKGLIWKDETILFMQNINQKFLPEIKMQVESYCKERKINNIFVEQVVNSKPDIRKIYANPLSFAFEAHYGSVFSLSFSPFIKSAFVSASMDGQIRIYQQSNARCLAVYEYIQVYILSAQFSPSRPCVFAACDSLGQILIFDLMQDTSQQIEMIKSEKNISASCLRFNNRQQDLLACSYQGCEIKIFQLNDNLIIEKDDEQKYFQQLFN